MKSVVGYGVLALAALSLGPGIFEKPVITALVGAKI